jgi:hypothetical protein
MRRVVTRGSALFTTKFTAPHITAGSGPSPTLWTRRRRTFSPEVDGALPIDEAASRSSTHRCCTPLKAAA